MKNPNPVKGIGAPTHELVRADMEARRAMGIKKYGVDHQHDNGRDHLRDAYEECLDMAIYLRAAIEAKRAAERNDSTSHD